MAEVRIQAGTNDVPSYTEDEVEFIRAMEEYRRTRRRPFPTCREVLAVLVSLGYRKARRAEDLPTVRRKAKPKADT
jgi:hypothetical protein